MPVPNDNFRSRSGFPTFGNSNQIPCDFRLPPDRNAFPNDLKAGGMEGVTGNKKSPL
jgi:hypothetical protein